MKSKIKSIISIVLAIVIAVSVFTVITFTFTGCGEPAKETEVDRVYSNGGSVVEYGQYVYFINGMAEYPSEDSTTEYNVNGSVKKGALYRVKKHDAVWNGGGADKSSVAAGEATEAQVADYKEQKNIDFVSSEWDWKDLGNYTVADYHDMVDDGNGNITEQPHYDHTNDYTEYRIDATEDEYNNKPIISKMIGVSSYRAGFYIFDNRIYFGSPSVTLDKEGKYQYSKIDFYTYDIKYKILSKLYTTAAGVDGEKIEYIPYNFYRQNGKVYLTTFEKWYANDLDEKNGKLTGYIVTTEITNGAAGEQTIVAKNVLAAYFPNKEEYHPDDSINTINDYVYFIRRASEDSNNYGLVIEMMRPNGDDRMIILNNGKDATIEGVSGGYFYYRNYRNGKQNLEYTNLYSQLFLSSCERTVGKDGSVSYTVDANDNYIEKDSKKTKTFLSEQREILAGFEAWAGENPNWADVSSDAKIYQDKRYQKYLNEYVQPMTDFSPIIIDDIENDLRKVSSIFLIPFKASDIPNVRVIVSTENFMLSVSPTESYLLNSATMTALLYYNSKIYGYDSENVFSFMSGVTAANGITKMNKEGSYSSVKNDALIVMEMLEVHDKKGNVVDTYAVYFTDYPDSEKATGYMVVIKVAGIYNIEGFYAVPMAYILPTERKVVTCYDPQCINYLHDHTERDGYTPGKNPESEEEGEQPQQ